MRYYYLVLDYNGWCVFSDTNLDDLRYMDYPFVTTCQDVAVRLLHIFRRLNVQPVIKVTETVSIADYLNK